MLQIVMDSKNLREPCKDASDPESQQIATKLFEVLSSTDGIGLAANQIGIQKRVFVTSIPDDEGQRWNRYFINPVISELSEPVRFDEGCLSFPDIQMETLRYNRCIITDLEYPKGLPLTGIEAICCQHETDHLNGLIMKDRKFNEVKVNGECPCGTGKKYKKCCKRNVVAFKELI